MGDITDKLDENWMANGILIAPKDATISPRDLLHPELEEFDPGADTGTNVTEDVGKGLFWSMIGSYRLMGINTAQLIADYRRRIESRLQDYLGTNPWNAEHISMFANSNRSLAERREYTVLIAAIDMFFHRFPKHDLAGCRIGTITSRNKSAAALNSLIYIRDLLGVSYGTLFSYLPYKLLLPEVKRMSKEESQELPNSYTHYLKEMGICPTSPYSSTANPLCYTLFHIIGTVLGVDRSCNAACVSSHSRPILLKLGITAAYFLAGVNNYSPIAAASANEANTLAQHDGRRPTQTLDQGQMAYLETVAEMGDYLEEDQEPNPEHGDGRDVINALNVMRVIPAPWRRRIGRRLLVKKPREGSIGKMVLEYVYEETSKDDASSYASAVGALGD